MRETVYYPSNLQPIKWLCRDTIQWNQRYTSLNQSDEMFHEMVKVWQMANWWPEREVWGEGCDGRCWYLASSVPKNCYGMYAGGGE